MGMLKSLFKTPKMPNPAPSAPAATEDSNDVEDARKEAGRRAARKKGLQASILAGEGRGAQGLGMGGLLGKTPGSGGALGG